MPTYLESLASYLPNLIREQLRGSSKPLDAPRADALTGAFLFGDITGFTPLAERLAQKGSAGVEELSRLLNGYFHRLITLIHSHGGDVTKFAGDAVLVVWPARDEPLSVALKRAAQCALAIQSELHNYQTFEGAQLSMRIGLGAGPMTLVQLGGMFKRWEALLTGLPIKQASQAESRCMPGQVILAPEAWALAQDDLQVEMILKQGRQGLRLLVVLDAPAPRSSPHLPLPAEAEAAARSYIPGAILQRLSAGQTDFLSELRRVSVIFVNLPDFESISDLERAQNLVQNLQRALYRYEGSVNQLLVDDKGTTLVAAMGLPPYSHEDDPIRGALAALDIQTVLKEMGQRYAIGVTTGHVYCGERGNSNRREYAMVGDAVNLSARLMQGVLRMGGNQIFCDSATWQASQGRLDFETLSPITVKGKSEPIPVYRPVAERRASVRSDTGIIGRQADRDRMGAAIQSLLRGEPKSPLIIEGDPGLGKTRLVVEINRQAQAGGLRVLFGAGDAIKRTSAYHVWRTVVRNIFGITANDPPELQRQKILAALPEAWRSWAALLNNFLQVDFQEPPGIAQLSPQERLEKTREMTLNLLRAACVDRPTLIILEDAHWFDTASWALTLEANRLSTNLPLLLVLTTRPFSDYRPTEYGQLLEQAGRQVVRLKPFSESEIASLISQRLHTERVADSLSQMIHHRSDGNPFFAEEITLALRDAGALQITPAECRLAPGVVFENVVLPETAQGLVSNRIDRLAPQEQMTLKVASVLGRVFDAKLLRAVYPLEADQGHLDEYLQELVRQDFIVPIGSDDYSFRHTLTREAIYSQMLFAQRRQLHRAVASWYERTYADDLSPYYPMLAHHSRLSLDLLQLEPAEVEKALGYLGLAGEQASSRLAYPEAIELFSHALSLILQLTPAVAARVPLSRQLLWRRHLGIAYVNMGQLVEGRHHLETVAARTGFAIPQKKLNLYWLLAGRMAWQFWHRLIPRHSKPQPGPLSERDLCKREAVWALLWLFQPYVFDNQFLQSLFATLSAANLAESMSNPPPVLQTAYSMLSFYASVLARPGLALYYENLARRTPSQPAHPTLQTALELMLATRAVGEGKWEEVRGIADKAIALLDRAGDYRQRGTMLNILGFAMYYQGQYYASLKSYRKIAELGRASGSIEFQAWGWNGVTLNYLRQGYWSEAQRSLAEAERLEPSIPGSNLTSIVTHAMFAQLMLVQGKPNQALTHVQYIEQLLSRAPYQFYFALDALGIRVEVYRHLARSGDVSFRQKAGAALLELKTFARAYPIGCPLALREQAALLLLDGKTTQARAAYLQSLEESRRLRMPFDEALAYWALGRFPTPDQAEYQQAARAHFQQIGALAYLDWLEKL